MDITFANLFIVLIAFSFYRVITEMNSK